jgi:hypothetical protein
MTSPQPDPRQQALETLRGDLRSRSGFSQDQVDGLMSVATVILSEMDSRFDVVQAEMETGFANVMDAVRSLQRD